MRRLLVLTAVPFLMGCGGQAGGAHDTSLHGTVTRGPITPVCVRGQSCSKPAAGVTLRFSIGSAVVAGVRTGGDGSYRINLPAGRYSVVGPKGLRPTRFSLPGDGSRRLDFLIDTGIR
jgi:hypothetical protein